MTANTTRKTNPIKDLAQLGDIMQVEEKQKEKTPKSAEVKNDSKNAATADNAGAAEQGTSLELHHQIESFITLICPFDQVKEPKKFWLWTLMLAGDTEEPEDALSMASFIEQGQKNPEEFLTMLMRNQGNRNERYMMSVRTLAESLAAMETKAKLSQEEVERLNQQLNEYMEINSELKKKASKVMNTATEILETQKGMTANLEKALEPVETTQAQKWVAAVPSTSVHKIHVEESYTEVMVKAVIVGALTAAAAYGTVRLLNYWFGDDSEA